MTDKSESTARRRFSQEDLQKVLQDHARWLKSNGKEGTQADFIWTDLTEADFTGADLRRAVFTDAHMYGAKFTNADLEDANLRGTFLIDSKFNDADCRNAAFSGAKMKGANLRHANLKWANLQDADLTDAKNLLANQLAGASLAGAKLPDDIAKFDALEHAKELSQNARKMFLAMLLGCAYTLLTVVTTDDVRLLTNSASSPLPIIGTEIPIVGFYIVAPLILLGLFVYFQLHLQRNWEVLATLPAFFPDGRPLDRKAYPWLLNGLVRVHSKLLNTTRPPMMLLQYFISIILAWGAVPFTLLALWARFLTRHDWTVTWIHVVVLTIGFAFTLFSYLVAKKCLRGVGHRSLYWKTVWKDTRTYKGVAVTALLAVVFYIGSTGAIKGVPPDRGEGYRTYVPYVLGLFGCEPFADFREKDVSVKPEGWTGDSTQFPLVKGANLKDRDLRYARLRSSFLMKADLRNCDIDRSNLRRANLRNADLSQSSLKFSSLRHADLLGADLDSANLRFAYLENAMLFGVSLVDANLSYTRLEGASLTLADMASTNIEFARLEGVELESATGLTINQIASAIVDSTTILPDYLIEQLRADTSESSKELLRQLGLD